MKRFLSLYDFLGKAAGPELGKQVEAAARAANIPIQHKHISNTVYSGKINMYPEQWLIGYFPEHKRKNKLQEKFSL